MKRILLFLCLAAGFTAQSQVYQKYNQYGGEWKRLQATILLGMPQDTIRPAADQQVYPQIAAIGFKIYIWDSNPDSLKWREYSNGTGATGLGNVGSGYRLAIPNTNNIKTLTLTNGLTADSAASNQLGGEFGGTLTRNTTVNTAANTLFFTGGPTKVDSLQVSNGATGEDFMIRDRNALLGFPVATFSPAGTVARNIAVDIMPSGSPGDYSNNGIAWLDIVDKDIRSTGPACVAARVGITSTAVQFGSREFSGASPKPVQIVIGTTTKMQLNASTNTADFNIGKVTQSQAISGDYVGYSLFNSNNSVAESNPIFFIGQDFGTGRFGYFRWNNALSTSLGRGGNSLEIVANNGATGGMLFGSYSTSGKITFRTADGGSPAGGDERMRIDSAGNVGIGTAPDSLFTVSKGIWGKRGVKFSALPTTVQAKVAMVGTDGTIYGVDTAGLFGGGGGGAGTVTSVATNNGSGITGGTITGAGTIAADTTNVLATRLQVRHRIDSLAATITGGGSFGSDNQIPYTNAGGTDFDYSSAFTYDGVTLTMGDGNVVYTYAGDVRGGWHKSQVGFNVSPGWGYGFSNANNFNTIDASFQRINSTTIGLFNGGIGASGRVDLEVADEAYDATTWNGSLEVPTKNAVRDKLETLVGEGTYTATLTNTTNIAASTPVAVHYARVGDWIHVWGTVSIDATLALTVSEMGMSLPIASGLTDVQDLAGTASYEDNTSVQIKADTANGRAKWRFTPQTATNNTYSFHFSYKYIAP